MSYIIYMHTNLTSGKSYIGLTRRGIDVRWKEHCSNARLCVNNGHFYRAIRFYGTEDWEHVILQDGISSIAEANAFEKAYILKYDTFENGYNSTEGGEGCAGLNPFYNKQPEEMEEYGKHMSATLYKRYNSCEISLYHKEHGVVTGLPGEIIKKYNIHTEIYNVINGKRRYIQGWFLYVGDNVDYNIDPVYTFIHDKYGIEILTLADMAKKYNLSKGNLCMVAKGKRKHTKGWYINSEER